MNASSTFQSERFEVIDAHTHIFPDAIADKARDSVGKFYNMPMFTTGTLSELYKARLMCVAPYKIAAQAIFSPAITAKQTKGINDFISSLCRSDKTLIGFGTLHKDNDDYAREIKRIKRLGLRGVKFHSDFQQTDIDDEKMLPIYREIANNKMPVIFHMGDKKLSYSSVSKLKNVIDELPDLVIIAAHMGGFSHWREAYDILPVNGNLYFDTSSTLNFISDYEFRAFIDKFGADKFFFGSDFPMWNPNEELNKLHRLNLSVDDFRKIEYYNFAGFLKKYC
ncbi:MAG: amidohydrolase family protein [Firmicutes bacterium]|nr:amidohydrolase family protein [Bacillota bacterium]